MRGQLQQHHRHAQGRRARLRDHRRRRRRATCRDGAEHLARRGRQARLARPDVLMPPAWRSSPRSRSTKRPRSSSALGIGALQRARAGMRRRHREHQLLRRHRRAARYVLTLFERLDAEQLPFYLQLMKHLADHGLPVPDPQADAQRRDPARAARASRRRSSTACPASTTSRPTPTHCAQRRRDAGAHAPAPAPTSRLHQPNLRGLAWWSETVPGRAAAPRRRAGAR